MGDSKTVDDVYDQVRNVLEQTIDASEGRPIAARLVLQGACATHSRLHAELEHWTQEFRALAVTLGGSGIWLEKVSLHTQPAMSVENILSHDDALGGLLRGIRDMELDDSALAELAHDVSGLRQKLPPEILTGEDSFDPSDPQQLQVILEDIKELLVNRLLTTGKI